MTDWCGGPGRRRGAASVPCLVTTSLPCMGRDTPVGTPDQRSCLSRLPVIRSQKGGGRKGQTLFG